MATQLKTLPRLTGVVVPVFAGALTMLFAVPLTALAQSISQVVRLDASLGEGLGLAALVALYGLLSALLLRSWRSLLLVPTSFFIGWEAGSVGAALFYGHALDGFTLLNGAGTFLLLLAPLLLGAATGTGIALREPRGGTPEQQLKIAAQDKWLHLPS